MTWDVHGSVAGDSIQPVIRTHLWRISDIGVVKVPTQRPKGGEGQHQPLATTCLLCCLQVNNTGEPGAVTPDYTATLVLRL